MEQTAAVFMICFNIFIKIVNRNWGISFDWLNGLVCFSFCATYARKTFGCSCKQAAVQKQMSVLGKFWGILFQELEYLRSCYRRNSWGRNFMPLHEDMMTHILDRWEFSVGNVWLCYVESCALTELCISKILRFFQLSFDYFEFFINFCCLHFFKLGKAVSKSKLNRSKCNLECQKENHQKISKELGIKSYIFSVTIFKLKM